MVLVYPCGNQALILTLEFTEALENRKKKKVKSRHKDYLTLTDFSFLKRFRLSMTSLSNILELIKTIAQ